MSTASALAGAYQALQVEQDGHSASPLWALTAALVVLAVASAIWWLMTRPDVEDAPRPLLVAGRDVVASVNQIGGQTAHTITNIGMQPRTLPEASTTLQHRLSMYAGTDIRVLVLAFDSEARQIAIEIEHLLRAAGWTITHPLNATLLSLPTPGVMVRTPAPRDRIPEALEVLARGLSEAGLAVALIHGVDDDENAVVVSNNGPINRSVIGMSEDRP